jgi:hypothetical protein
MSIDPPPRPEIMGQRVVTDDCDFGWVTAWTSEMGDEASLAGLLAHADRYMNPSWTDGGLYYPRNDTVTDENGNRVLVEPMTGNVLLGYARLNVPDGLWGLYNEPWSPDRFLEPMLVAIGDNVDVGRAVFDPETRALHFSLRCRGGDAATNTAVIGNLPDDGSWKIRARARSLDFLLIKM